MVGTLPAASGADHGSCSAATEQEKTSAFWSTGLFWSTSLSCLTKAGQGLARWSGRDRAERLGGVKLIALIPLHVSHPDPGNYRAECLTPISRQMPPGWKQMEEQDGDGMSRVSLGKIPGAQLRGRQVTAGHHSAAPWLCPPAQAGKCNLRHHMSPVTLGAPPISLSLSPNCSNCSHPVLLPVSGTLDSCSISFFCQRALVSLPGLDEPEGKQISGGALGEGAPPLVFHTEVSGSLGVSQEGSTTSFPSR